MPALLQDKWTGWTFATFGWLTARIWQAITAKRHILQSTDGLRIVTRMAINHPKKSANHSSICCRNG
jgi:hypothetical protein